MRIAVSGTHGVGKSTLIEEFLRVHSNYAHEPEPYVVMVEELGEEFGEPSVEDFRRQLEFNINRLEQHASGAKVIYERCPLDFLAYIDALDHSSAETLRRPVTEAMQDLDLILYLPLEADAVSEEYAKLQQAVDRRLSTIFREDELDILTTSDVTIVEASGSTAQRLRTLEDVIRSLEPTL
jgi:hypothetical protein